MAVSLSSSTICRVARLASRVCPSTACSIFPLESMAIMGIRVCMGQTRVQPLSRCGLLLRRSSLLEEPRNLARVGLDFVCFLPSFWNISPFAPSGFGPFTFVTIPWCKWWHFSYFYS
ncbi:hypothetical protein F2Q70_00038991 [Brassica cretica]|uniref:Uncharacterized protein n=1 Tax=Brassica cretica TaxID=69181 RepID=A0A8S9K2E2_BRACR|nr:hypothetical protein F2Q70_00038991 [Brassica cretica]